MKERCEKGHMLAISDLQAIPYAENREPLVNLEQNCAGVLCDYRRKDSDVNCVLVRLSLCEKLQSVQKQLMLIDASLQLLVVEGYRCLSYQERYFMQHLLLQQQNDSSVSFELLLERTHQFVALPSVAGHPTGGAIDLTIAYQGQEVDMGGGIADFTTPRLLPTYSPLASREQAQRRILLHDLMMAEGFAPFYGEWWHFSYGDREWAAFYAMSEAIYSPMSL